MTREAMHKLMAPYLTGKAGEYIALLRSSVLKSESGDDEDDEKRKAQLEQFITAVEDGEVSWDDLPEKVQEVLAPMADAGAKDALAQLEVTGGVDFDVVNEAAVAWARERSAELVGMKYNEDGELVDNPRAEWSIDETTRDNIRDLVTQATEEGWSMDDLASAIASDASFSDERAMTIARTESATADVQGNLVGYREAKSMGIEVKKEWITAGDDLVSEDCAANGEQGPIELDDNFQSGASAPPEHPNCRCDLIPVRLASESDDSGDDA